MPNKASFGSFYCAYRFISKEQPELAAPEADNDTKGLWHHVRGEQTVTESNREQSVACWLRLLGK